MKKIILILLSFLINTVTSTAQTNRSEVNVQLSDHQLLTIVVDGREYQKSGSKITIGNLPSGKHRLKVYRYFPPNNNNRVAHAQLVFEGKIKIRPSSSYLCIVDANRHSINIREMNITSNSNHTATISHINKPQNNPSLEGKIIPETRLNEVGNLAEQKITDTEKLKLLKDSLENSSFSSAQIATILHWLTFEDSKLEFAKWAFPKTLDKENYNQLKALFTNNASQKIIDNMQQSN
jgi:hypothetical protein